MACYPYKWDTIYHEYEFNKLDFYHPNIEKFWKSNIVLESKNVREKLIKSEWWNRSDEELKSLVHIFQEPVSEQILSHL